MSYRFSPAGFVRFVAIPSLVLAVASPVVASPGEGDKSTHDQCGYKRMSHLSVTGQGEVRAAPDLAVIQIGVNTQADSASAAMKENSEQQGAVIDALKVAEIDSSNIQTAGLNLNPMIDYGEGQNAKVLGYQASNVVSVRVTEISKLGEVLDTVVSAGANNINGINFLRENSQDVEDDARRSAVEDARHKAEVMAEAAGMTLGPIMVMRDSPVQSGPEPMMMRAADAKSASTPVEPGEIAVSAEVMIDFALQGTSTECGSQDKASGKAETGDEPNTN